MSVAYEVLYRIGFTPWERGAAAGAAQLARLFDREEQERTRPLGRALDLGCGTGIQTLDLASRGWEAVGVDNVETALKRARQRQGPSSATFLRGDVTRLGELGLGQFDFFLDIGCFHGLHPDERAAMAQGVTDAANPGATLLSLCFTKAVGRGLPSGASREELADTYAAWSVIDQEAAETSGMPKPLRKTEPRFYRLRLG